MNDDYFDSHGFIHPQKNKKSNKGILYRAILDNWTRLNKGVFYDDWQKCVMETIAGEYKLNFSDSIENMIGIYAVCKIHGLKLLLKSLPLIKWNNKNHFSLKSICIFLAFKYSILKYNPLLYFMALKSLLSKNYLKMDEKNLWFLVFTILNIKWPLKLAQKRYRNYNLHSSYQLFECSHIHAISDGLLFDNLDNPIIKEVKHYYKKSRKF